MSDEYELEYSPLCGRIERDGRAVRVEIYRGTETPGNIWILEVVDEDSGASIVWHDQFPTDAEAMAALQRDIDEHGLDGVVDSAPEVEFPQ